MVTLLSHLVTQLNIHTYCLLYIYQYQIMYTTKIRIYSGKKDNIIKYN